MLNDDQQTNRGPFEGLTVVVADQDSEIRNSIKSSRNDIGFSEIFVAQDIQQLRKILDEKDVSALVSDLTLPGGSAIGLAREIRFDMIGHNPSMLLIGMVNDSRKETVRRAINAGFDDVIRKPITIGHLMLRFEYLATRPRQFLVSPNYVGPNRRGPKSQRDESDKAKNQNVKFFDLSLDNQNYKNPDNLSHLRSNIAKFRSTPWQTRIVPILLNFLELLENVAHDLTHHADDINHDIIKKFEALVDRLQHLIEEGETAKASDVASELEQLTTKIDQSGHSEIQEEIRLLGAMASVLTLALKRSNKIDEH